ncbi:LLM class flavin-dependent oxidoreductase [Rathayibacter sp. CAU 1779]
MVLADVSIGMAGTLGPEAIGRLAPTVEAGGFASLWVNDTPGGDSLAVLAAASDATQRLTLSTGVIPVDRRSPEQILAGIRSSELPESRLRIGIGAGQRKQGGLALVGDAVVELQSASQAEVLVGALGPRMRRLGAESADGILLSWLTPRLAREQADEAHEVTPDAHVALYVRAAIDRDAAARLAEEARRYAGYPTYSANFARLGIRAEETVLDPAAFTDRLAEYREAVDEVVLRAITPGDTVDDYTRFAEQVAGLLGDI